DLGANGAEVRTQGLKLCVEIHLSQNLIPIGFRPPMGFQGQWTSDSTCPALTFLRQPL
ncbi:unnamed protein product, partial [Rotaria socialis]